MTTRPARAAAIFLSFAFSYFISALLRAVTATLAPVFSAELGLQAADLGLLAGAYFLGFASMQLQGRQLVPRPTAALQLRPLLVGVRGILLGPLLGARVCLAARLPSVYGTTKLLFQQRLHGEPPSQANTTLSMDSLAALIAAKVSIDNAGSQDRFDGGLQSFARWVAARGNVDTLRCCRC